MSKTQETIQETNQESGNNPSTQKEKEKPRPQQVYAVLNPGLYGTLLIPADEFRKLFIRSVSGGMCKINKEEEKRIDSFGMGMCVDTILQSYSLSHIRGCWGRGEWRPGLHLIGSYYLVDEEEFNKYERRRNKQK